MPFDVGKLYPGCIIGVSDTLNPLSEVIQFSETWNKDFLSKHVATHIQIATVKNDLVKLVEMDIKGIRINEASEDKEGLLGDWGNHVVFVGSWIAPDDYDAQDKAVKLLDSYLKAGYKYALPELFTWWGFNYHECPQEKICSTLERQFCKDMGFPHSDNQFYSPWEVQKFYFQNKKLIYPNKGVQHV